MCAQHILVKLQHYSFRCFITTPTLPCFNVFMRQLHIQTSDQCLTNRLLRYKYSHQTLPFMFSIVQEDFSPKIQSTTAPNATRTSMEHGKSRMIKYQKIGNLVFCLDVQSAISLWRARWCRPQATLSIRNASLVQGNIFLCPPQFSAHFIRNSPIIDAKTPSLLESESPSRARIVCVRSVSKQKRMSTSGSNR